MSSGGGNTSSSGVNSGISSFYDPVTRSTQYYGTDPNASYSYADAQGNPGNVIDDLNNSGDYYSRTELNAVSAQLADTERDRRQEYHEAVNNQLSPYDQDDPRAYGLSSFYDPVTQSWSYYGTGNAGNYGGVVDALNASGRYLSASDLTNISVGMQYNPVAVENILTSGGLSAVALNPAVNYLAPAIAVPFIPGAAAAASALIGLGVATLGVIVSSMTRKEEELEMLGIDLASLGIDVELDRYNREIYEYNGFFYRFSVESLALEMETHTNIPIAINAIDAAAQNLIRGYFSENVREEITTVTLQLNPTRSSAYSPNNVLKVNLTDIGRTYVTESRSIRNFDTAARAPTRCAAVPATTSTSSTAVPGSTRSTSRRSAARMCCGWGRSSPRSI